MVTGRKKIKNNFYHRLLPGNKKKKYYKLNHIIIITYNIIIDNISINQIKSKTSFVYYYFYIL